MIEANDQKSMSELLQEYCEENRIYRFEGSAGVRNLEKIVKMLGYNDRFSTALEAFLEDNSGACDTLMEWIGEQEVSEWRKNIIAELPEQDNEDEDEDED